MYSAPFRRSMSFLIAVLIALVGLTLSLGMLAHLTGVDFGFMPSKVRTAPGEIFCVTPSGATDVIIDKGLTIRGGYSTSNWVVSAPAINPTTLDAQTKGRVLYATGNISLTIEALNLINGDATGLGGELAWTGDTGGEILPSVLAVA